MDIKSTLLNETTSKISGNLFTLLKIRFNKSYKEKLLQHYNNEIIKIEKIKNNLNECIKIVNELITDNDNEILELIVKIDNILNIDNLVKLINDKLPSLKNQLEVFKLTRKNIHEKLFYIGTNSNEKIVLMNQINELDKLIDTYHFEIKRFHTCNWTTNTLSRFKHKMVLNTVLDLSSLILIDSSIKDIPLCYDHIKNSNSLIDKRNKLKLDLHNLSVDKESKEDVIKDLNKVIEILKNKDVKIKFVKLSLNCYL